MATRQPSHDHPGDSPDRIVSIGSDPGNDIRLDASLPFHVKVACRPDTCVVEDLSRVKLGFVQTFLAPQDSPGTRIPVNGTIAAAYDDVLYLGSYPFPLFKLRPRGPPSALAGRIVTIGADPANRIVVDSPSVSPLHAEFRLESERCWVRDRGSTNGTFLQDPQEPTHRSRIGSDEWTELSYHDFILLGGYRFHLSRLQDVKDIPARQGTQVKVGRTPDNDCVLGRVFVSSQHARFLFQDGRIMIEDLASVGGTFVNSQRLVPNERRDLASRDRVKIGSYDLYLDPSSKDYIRVDYSGEVRLDVENLECFIGDRKVLHGLSLSIQPGELIGVLGPSGHGKSVLLECLARKPSLRVRGSVRINGQPVEQFTTFEERTGYVPQGEVLPLQLTVDEALRYAARLWIQSDLLPTEVDQQVSAVLNQLNIRHLRHQPMRVLSGGELRRVSIAHELIRSPSLLLLDEPTTGLSTKDARVVVNCLKELALAGHTIVSVIHQPSRDIYSLFDQVAVLFAGHLLYFGPPQFSYDYFGSLGSHPEDVFAVLEKYEAETHSYPERRQELIAGWAQRYRESPEHERYVLGRLSSRENQ